MSSGLVPVQRALISVSDKTGLIPFASALANEFNIELVSTGGTASVLRDAGLPVSDVADLTGFPEMLDGRVKTLHPVVHGGLLAVRDNPSHAESLRQHNIRPIDLVVVNLYPFQQTIAKPGTTFEQAIEQIDIGGPSMIRSAAKNHAWVLVVTSPDRYDKVLGDLREHGGSSCATHRLKQAQRAFATTAAYDAGIADYLAQSAKIDATQKTFVLNKAMDLRYGENPHQPAALWTGRKPAEASVAFAQKLHGKELSYINLLDADAALGAVKEFSQAAACIVKHATPCGCCEADTLAAAFAGAYAGDPLAAFGGIVALNRRVDLPAAEAITSIDKLLEVIVAPGYEPAALDLLRQRWKNVRLLEVGQISQPGSTTRFDPAEQHMHKIVGGYLIQQRDTLGLDETGWKVATRRSPTESELRDLRFAWLACKHVKSNAIVIARDRALVGVGAGQMDRPAAAGIAISKAGPRAAGGVAASDAFFPFPDAPELLLKAGVTAIVHPGGSLKDADTIALADKHNAAIVLTGQRHFKH
jgi:phosphoribosylaminoimidazolecarboxamide formyltransferase/IMP cyclohydrolase